jgi:hypothetical protein
MDSTNNLLKRRLNQLEAVMRNLKKLMSIKFASKDYLTTSEIAKMFNVSQWSIYEAIKTDPTFPFNNLGPKKNYRINPKEYKKWSQEKSHSTRIRNAKLLSFEELLGGSNAKS